MTAVVRNGDYELVGVSYLREHPDNPRRGNEDAIAASIAANGWYGALAVQQSTGYVIAGNHRLRAARSLGITEVPVIWLDVDDAAARRILLADNRVSDLATWDEEALAALLRELQEDEVELTGAGWTSGQVDDLLTDLGVSSANTAALAEAAQIKGSQPSPRNLPLDVIFTFSNLGHPAPHFAYDAGLRVGVRSSYGPQVLRVRERWAWRFPLTFVDNEWREYDHTGHRDFVAEVRPKYATVCDVMTKAQCAAIGAEWHALPQILEWAEELEQYAEHVIVIPKYDCIDAIPERFMLGYSVPTLHGGTPLPADAFKGRRIHLLGGSWSRQLAYLSLLGDDIVSLDNNHIAHIALYAQFVMPDGRQVGVDETLGHDPSNPYLTCLALSLGSIARAVHDLTQGRSAVAEELDEAVREDVAAASRDGDELVEVVA